MQYYVTQIENQEHTIVKPIIAQVLQRVKHDAYFNSSTPIYILDQTGSINEVGSELTDRNDNDLILDNSSKIIASYRESFNNEIAIMANVNPREVIPIWLDADLGMSLRPVRIRKEVEIELRYKGKSKTDVDSWLGLYYRRLATGVTFSNLEVAYEITIPEPCLKIAEAVYIAREKKAGYGEDYFTYLKKHFLVPTELKTNIVGKGASLVARERLTHLPIGLPKELPEATRMESGGYEATITLKFVYDKPVNMIHTYPIFVHNSYIDRKYIDLKKDRNKELPNVTVATTDYFKVLTNLYGSPVLRKTGYVVPAFDSTELIDNYPMINILQVQIQVGVNDPRLLLDLSQLEADTGYKLHSDIIPYLYSLGKDALVSGRGLYCLSVYRDGQRVNPDRYYIDKNLQLRSDYDLNMRGNYHVSISIIKNVQYLSQPAVDELINNGKLVKDSIIFLKPSIPEEYVPVVNESGDLDPGTVDKEEVYKAFEYITSTNKTDSSMRLVNTIIVSSKQN